MLTVVGRWDYRVTDPEAVMAAGRAEYLGHWSDDTEEDATFSITDVRIAAGEVMHGDAVGRLDGVSGLEKLRYVTTVLTHDGAEDGTFEADPFRIAVDDSDQGDRFTTTTA